MLKVCLSFINGWLFIYKSAFINETFYKNIESRKQLISNGC